MSKKDKRAILIRHRGSGVWVGYLIGPGTIGDSIEIEGRRIWSWSGGRLECSQLAKQGFRATDRLGEWETVEIGSIAVDLVELRTVDPSIVEAARKLAAARV